jgi:hypothetical protein
MPRQARRLSRTSCHQNAQVFREPQLSHMVGSSPLSRGALAPATENYFLYVNSFSLRVGNNLIYYVGLVHRFGLGPKKNHNLVKEIP